MRTLLLPGWMKSKRVPDFRIARFPGLGRIGVGQVWVIEAAETADIRFE
jgi:hypothetical protein